MAMKEIVYKDPETNALEKLNVDEADWEDFKKSRYAVGKAELKKLKKQKIGPQSFEKSEWVMSLDAFLGFGGSIYLGLAFVSAVLFILNPLAGIAFMGGSLFLGGIMGGLWARATSILSKEERDAQAKALQTLETKETYFEYLESDNFVRQLNLLASKSAEELKVINDQLPPTHLLKGLILDLAGDASAAPDRIKAVQEKLANQYLVPQYKKAQATPAPSLFAPAMRYGMQTIGTLGLATMVGGVALGIASVVFAAPVLAATVTASLVTAATLIIGLPFALATTALKQKIDTLRMNRAKAIDQFSQQQSAKVRLVDHMGEVQRLVQDVSGLKPDIVMQIENKNAQLLNQIQEVQADKKSLQEELGQAQATIRELREQLMKQQVAEKERIQLEKEAENANAPKAELPKKTRAQTNFFEHKEKEIVTIDTSKKVEQVVDLSKDENRPKIT